VQISSSILFTKTARYTCQDSSLLLKVVGRIDGVTYINLPRKKKKKIWPLLNLTE
jgi:hypothetical protein